MDIPVNEVIQWLAGVGSLGTAWGMMKAKVARLEQDLEDRTGKLERQSDTDTKLMVAFTRVETKVDGLTERMERVERKVLNGDSH